MTVGGLRPEEIRPPERTALLVVDIQEKLMPAMAAAQQPVVEKAVSVLAALARRAGWPVLVTEQYPQGLGRTLPALRAQLEEAGAAAPLEKMTFSACGAQGFAERLGDVEAVVLAGMESHVCVLETALDLRARGYRVYVPWDAVASRREEDRHTGLELMRAAGALVTSSETLVFQHLKEAGSEAFKDLARRLR